MEAITPTRSASESAVERIVLALLDEISYGHLQGDEALLRSLRLPPAIADSLSKSDRILVARAIARQGFEAITIAINQDALASILEHNVINTRKDRLIRALVDRGATHNMLKELGLQIERKRFRELCKSVPQGYSYGRPPELDQIQIRHLHSYWSTCAAPQRTDPIEHLLNTAIHLDLRLASIWSYLQEHPHPAPKPREEPSVPHWVFLMFPKWQG